MQQVDKPTMERDCKTVIRIATQGLANAFRIARFGDLPRVQIALDAYWTSLCRAHIPVVNRLIQKYRLATYDFFVYEVSEKDIPVWHVRQGGDGIRAAVFPYIDWDEKPTETSFKDLLENKAIHKTVSFADADSLLNTSLDDVTPGEFDLLDARSCMERGDYTGAVRRTTTALEAVVEWALRRELANMYSTEEVERRLKAGENDFPGRLRQLQKIRGKEQIPQVLVEQLDATRQVRHDIVHRARRISYNEQGMAQRSVDTGRWLFNKIEQIPERAELRERGVLKSIARPALAPRFPTFVTRAGIQVRPLVGARADESK